MNYKETCEYLFSQTPSYEKQGASGYKEGLETTIELDKHFGHPHKNFRTIHVAGTNGKGSVTHNIAAQLQMCGYRVGLYTSPHIVDFSERIRINGKPISEDYVVQFVEKERAFFEPLDPSFFEITTAMAFKYFSDMNVDIAVIEVGLGGRLDCTNIITPILSVITNISLDHTQLLGNSLAEIAMEKGGIIKPGVPVVIGEATPETREVFDALSSEAHAPIYYAEDEQEITSAKPLPNGGMHYESKHLGCFDSELGGAYQVKNMNTIAVALLRLIDMGHMPNCTEGADKKKIQSEMNKAFQNVCTLTGLMGRWQTISEKPTVVCDTGHNPGAWEHLGSQLSAVKCREMRIVFGMVGDKDVYTVMSKLPKHATYFYTKGSTERAMAETTLKVFGDRLGLRGECYPNVSEAYNAAIDGATSDDFIFIGGSTYVVSDFMKSRI